MGNIFDCSQNPLNLPDEGRSAPGDAASGKPTVLQGPTRLKDSIVWTLQRAFYQKMGVAAWSDAIVPNFVTSNSYIARGYAKTILGYINDMHEAPAGSPLAVDPSLPVYIVEVGAGHGKLGYLVIEALLRLREYLPTHKRSDAPIAASTSSPEGEDPEEADLRNLPFKYIMTDFSEQNVEFWQNHPSLKSLVELGLLDFAVFDAEKDTTLKLLHCGDVITPESRKNPMVFVANYVFDTLASDGFRINSGELQRAFVSISLGHSEEPGDPTNPDILRTMEPQWTYSAVDPAEDFFNDPAMNELVTYYTTRFQNASFLIPVGGLTMCKALTSLSNDRLLLLIGDKGYSAEEEIEGLRDPHVAIHGSFSLMVNLHSVSRYFDKLGGSAMHTPGLEGFKCAAVYLGGDICHQAQSRWAFKEGIQDFGPESFSTLQRCVKDECPNPSLKHVLALLRLANHDSDVFYKFKQVLIDKIVFPYATELIQMDVRSDIEKVFAGYYPLQESKDICFEVGRMLMGLKEYGSAVEFFKRSAELCGQHHVTWHNMGICLFYQDLLEDAEKCFQESLALKPTYAEAHTWLLQVREKLMKERRGPGPMPGPAPGAIRAAQSSEEDDEESEGDEDSDVSK